MNYSTWKIKNKTKLSPRVPQKLVCSCGGSTTFHMNNQHHDSLNHFVYKMSENGENISQS